LLLDGMNTPAVFALLDETTPNGVARARSRLYTGHAGTLSCSEVHDWPQLLARLQEVLEAGLYAVPVLSYELGEQLLGVAQHQPERKLDAPLAQVLLFERYEAMDAAQVDDWLRARTQETKSGPAGVAQLRANVDEAGFARAIDSIRDYIAAGDTYQVNYTYRLRFDAFGSVFALYARLRARQPVPYGALVGLPDGRTVLSLSPELFVRHDSGRLLARPMKGTAPAFDDDAANESEADEKNAARAKALAEDPKNRAENLMIVDLLRNDLGRVARTGSVGVPALFEVRRYGSVLQMTSTIQAQLQHGASLADIFAALYPCGSITGAPKRRTMQIIHELEPAARGIYTGAIGWIDPASPGHIGDFCLSVPIRTLTLMRPQNGVRHGELGVGAGIVYDSEAGAEWSECRLKARFLTELPNEFEIFETMYATRDQGCRHLERHLARLQASCDYFGHRFDLLLARAAALQAASQLPEGAHRLRLAVRPDRELVLQSGQLAPLQEPVELLLSDEPTHADDLFLRHKTSVRSRYDAAWRAAESQGAFDTLFFNERDELTEGGRSNVFVRIGGRWYTPPLSAGLLPGVMRAAMLDDPSWGAIEVPISRAMLLRAQEVVVCNALRGPLRAVLRARRSRPGRPP
jgi:para-aminobenzoate synthetase/4-amino-4-deoxychorismate lyase